MPLSNPTITPPPPRLLPYVLYAILGLIPFVFVAGLDAPDLLPRLLLFQLGTLIITLVWIHLKAPHQSSPFHFSLLIYILIMTLSVFWATTPFRSVHFLAKHISFFCFFWILSNTIKKHHIPNLLTVTALAGTGVSLFGILEYHNIIPHWIPSTGRPSSTFMFRNLAAHYLVVNLPLAGLLFLIAQKSLHRWISCISASTMFIFLLYTRTRGAWVGLFCATILNLVLWFICHRATFYQAIRTHFNRQSATFVIASLLFIAILGPLPASFKEQHTQRFDEKKADISSAVTSIFKTGGDRGRTKMWQHTLSMIAENPWGVGLGNWEFLYPRYDKGEQISPDTTPRRPHNDLLWIASEVGILGLFAYLSILIMVLIINVRIWKINNAPQNHFMVLMCGIAMFAMIGDGFFNFPYERIPPVILFWLSLSIIVVCYKDLHPTPVKHYPTRFNILLPILLIGAICITLKNIAFDYHYIRAVRASLQSDVNTESDEAGKALRYGPFNHQALVIYGSALKEQKRFVQAEQALQRALNYHPYFANIYNNIGHLYDDWGRLEDATQAYHKTIQLMPTHHKAIYNLGIIYEKKDQPDSAKAAYHKAIATNGDFGKAYHNLAGIFNKQGQPDSARFYYEKAIRAVNSTPESYFNLGNLFAQQKHFKAAIQAYEAFIANWQGDAIWLVEAQKGLSEAYSGLGVQTEQQGDLDQALILYQTAIKHWPDNAMNWYNLGNVYRLQDNSEQAISAYKKAIENDNQFVNAYNNMGLTYTNLKQYSKAVETFTKSLKIHPENPANHINLANAYLGKGDIYRAIDSYETFLSLWDREDDTQKQVLTILKELKASIK